MSTVEVPRPPRVVPRMPGGELALEPPPEPERPVPPGSWPGCCPAVMLLGSVAFVALGPRDPSSLLFGGMFALSTVGMLLVGGGGRGAGQRQAAVDEERRDYLRYLAATRRRVRAVAAEQRAALEHVHPDPAAWPAVLAAGRLWERRGTDPDFGLLRVGHRRAAAGDHAGRPADRARSRGSSRSRRSPCAASCARTRWSPTCRSRCRCAAPRAIWLEPAPGAGPEPARALARALVAQYVLWHSPADALLAVVAPPYLAPEWEWVKWLPHVGHPRRRDAVGPVRMVTARGGRRPAVVGGRAGRPDARARRRASRTCSWSSTTRQGPARGPPWPGRRCCASAPRPGRRPDAGGGAPPRRVRPNSSWADRCGHRRGRRAARTRSPSRRPRRWPAASPATGPPEPVPPPAPATAAGLPELLGLDSGARARGRRSAPPSESAARSAGRARRGPAAGADRRRRDRRAGGAGPQGVRPGRQRAARPLRRAPPARARASCCGRSSSAWWPRTRRPS